MENFRRLVVLSAIPIFASIITYFVFSSDRFTKFDERRKQILIGILFGLIAITSTEFGVKYQGAIINARAVSPLCAGLLFGPLAGIIAGIIGGVERWLCVYWGGGYYTQVACSISTILTGFIAAYLRREIFEDKTPNWLLALFTGAFCETMDMLLIFLTNLSDVRGAFEYVKICSAPMISIAALSVGAAVLIIQQIEKDEAGSRKAESVSFQYQKTLVVAVVGGFIVTSALTYLVQKRISTNDTFFLLALNTADTADEALSQVDKNLLHITTEIGEDYYDDLKGVEIDWLADYYRVAEINIIDRNGIVIDSNCPENIGFDIAKSRQQHFFLYLLTDVEEEVMELTRSDYPGNQMRKYAAISWNDGIVQVAYDEDQYEKDLYDKLHNLANNRRVGEDGTIMVTDGKGNIISDDSFYRNKNIDDLELVLIEGTNLEGEVNRAYFLGTDSYYLYRDHGDFRTYAFLPVSEADFSMWMATYMNIFMEIIVFGLLFVIIYFITKYRIVDKIDDVNESLEKITNGQLDTVVDVRSSEEFISLSNGINSTVDSLKQFIKEANERIDSELRYAKEIQFSALPSTFPPFPDRNEFDIYALMDPAREVGGDFYDFYILDDYKLVFLVADVAGKGIPASLFMMRAKTTLKSFTESGMGVAEVFTNANSRLNEGNDAGMFVTAWMGILNLETGELKYANAGHNRPLIKRKDGSFEYLKGPAGFVLAGMNGITYKEQQMMLSPGDEIFLYTDGVVEATDLDKQLYGDDRLLACVNEHEGEDAMTLCKSIKQDVEEFYEGAEQFDDITELSLQLKSYQKG